MKRSFAVALFVTAVFLCFGFSYTYISGSTPPYREGTVIHWNIHLGADSTVPNQDGTMSYNQVAQDAFTHANEYVNINQTSSIGTPEIVSSSAEKLGDGINGVYFNSGYTDPSVLGTAPTTGFVEDGLYITAESDIQLRHFGADNDSQWQSSRTGKGRNIFLVILHEMGHCLGLGHTQSDKVAVMQASTGDPNTRASLTQDDVDGLNSIYGVKPGAPSPTPWPRPTPRPTPSPSPTPETAIPLTSGVSKSGTLPRKAEVQYYIDATEETQSLIAELSGTGDADIYIKKGAKASKTAYDALSRNNGSAEKIKLNPGSYPQIDPGSRYYIYVFANTASNVSLKVTLSDQVPLDTAPVVTIVKPETDVLTVKRSKLALTVAAMDDDEVDYVQYRINGGAWKNLAFKRRSGSYTASVRLFRGTSTVEVQAVDNVGQVSTSESITVTY